MFSQSPKSSSLWINFSVLFFDLRKYTELLFGSRVIVFTKAHHRRVLTYGRALFLASMASINKLSVRGVRAFSPEDAEQVSE
jgi:hypothetical protein